MGSLNYIFAEPDKVDEIVIYPIRLKDYDKFMECQKLLYVSKAHFEDNPYPLLALIFMSHKQLEYTTEQIIEDFTALFSLVTRKEVTFISNDDIEGFMVDKNNLISIHNYDAVRKVIMKQNLMFEQKIYKNPLTQEWANMILEKRAKEAPKITMEDMITTIKNYDGITYEQLSNQTIYQTHADFYRISKIMHFEQSSLFATVSSEKTTIEHFAEFINLFKSPYEDLFVSKDKLKNVNKVFNSNTDTK